jgi:hypothetical protein
MTVSRRRPSWWFSRNELSGEPGEVHPVGARDNTVRLDGVLLHIDKERGRRPGA